MKWYKNVKVFLTEKVSFFVRRLGREGGEGERGTIVRAGIRIPQEGSIYVKVSLCLHCTNRRWVGFLIGNSNYDGSQEKAAPQTWTEGPVTGLQMIITRNCAAERGTPGQKNLYVLWILRVPHLEGVKVFHNYVI